jgi:hypothetical protein
MRRRLTTLLGVVLLAVPLVVRANGDSVAAGPPTVYERFVLSACAPCIRETYPIAALAVTPPPVSWFPRTAAAPPRPGEITIEVLRAQQPARPDWKSLALRMTLSVTASPGEAYRLATGLLDGVDVGPLARAVAEMATTPAPPPANSSAGSVEVDFHGGSLRIGVLSTRSGAVAYVQAGDLMTLMQRALWEVPTTLFLSVADLPALATALGRAAATIEKARGN